MSFSFIGANFFSRKNSVLEQTDRETTKKKPPKKESIFNMLTRLEKFAAQIFSQTIQIFSSNGFNIMKFLGEFNYSLE